MATYNVFVPARKGSDLPDLSIKVEASNWLVALKESLRQIGEQGDSLANIVCETASDGALRVADPNSKRVFVIRQAEDEGDDKMAEEADRRAAESRRLAEMAAKAKDETESRLRDVETRMGSSTPVPKAVEEVPKPDQADATRKLEEEKQRLQAELAAAQATLEVAANKAADEATGILGKVEIQELKKDKKAKVAKGDEWDDLDDWYDDDDEPQEESIDNMIADAFLATDDLHELDDDVAARKVLALVNKFVSAEAASIFYSDMNSALKDLVIKAASGPIGDKIVGIHVPVGKGIVGFCVQNGVKLIVNNVQHNPNFYGKLDQEFGFSTRSILCVPVQHNDRTFGAIELINSQGEGGQWSGNDTNIAMSLGTILGRAVETRIETSK